jgi:hypothetical protein
MCIRTTCNEKQKLFTNKYGKCLRNIYSNDKCANRRASALFNFTFDRIDNNSLATPPRVFLKR